MSPLNEALLETIEDLIKEALTGHSNRSKNTILREVLKRVEEIKHGD